MSVNVESNCQLRPQLNHIAVFLSFISGHIRTPLTRLHLTLHKALFTSASEPPAAPLALWFLVPVEFQCPHCESRQTKKASAK